MKSLHFPLGSFFIHEKYAQGQLVSQTWHMFDTFGLGGRFLMRLLLQDRLYEATTALSLGSCKKLSVVFSGENKGTSLKPQRKTKKNEVLLGCSRQLVKGKWVIIYFLEHPSTYMLSMANPLLGCVYLRSKYHKFSSSKTALTAASILDNEKVMENHRFFSWLLNYRPSIPYHLPASVTCGSLLTGKAQKMGR